MQDLHLVWDTCICKKLKQKKLNIKHLVSKWVEKNCKKLFRFKRFILIYKIITIYEGKNSVYNIPNEEVPNCPPPPKDLKILIPRLDSVQLWNMNGLIFERLLMSSYKLPLCNKKRNSLLSKSHLHVYAGAPPPQFYVKSSLLI